MRRSISQALKNLWRTPSMPHRRRPRYGGLASHVNARWGRGTQRSVVGGVLELMSAGFTTQLAGLWRVGGGS